MKKYKSNNSKYINDNLILHTPKNHLKINVCYKISLIVLKCLNGPNPSYFLHLVVIYYTLPYFVGRKRPRVSKFGHQILTFNRGYMWLEFYLQSFISTPYPTITYLNLTLQNSFSDASTQHPHIVLRGSNSTHTFYKKNTSWVVFDPYFLYRKYFVGRLRPI